MKKTILFLALLCVAGFSFAQSDRYASAMKSNISLLDSIMIKHNAAELVNNFIRIAEAEKTQWLPYYYAAYATVIEALTETDNSKKDAVTDKAKELINKAESILGKESSEIDVIKSMIATSYMTVDPQSRYMSYSSEINDNIEKAKKSDPTNPRPYLFQAQNIFYTPEQFGGGKETAKPLFDKAKELFTSFKPETELSPNWGKSTLDYFLAQYK
jgi:hypothetical protein